MTSNKHNQYTSIPNWFESESTLTDTTEILQGGDNQIIIYGSGSGSSSGSTFTVNTKYVLSNNKLKLENLTVQNKAISVVEIGSIKIGDLVDALGWVSSDYVVLSENSKITFDITRSDKYGIVFYGWDKKVLTYKNITTADTLPVVFDVPKDTYFFRVCSQTGYALFNVDYIGRSNYTPSQRIMSDLNTNNFLNLNKDIPEYMCTQTANFNNLNLVVQRPLVLVKDDGNNIKLTMDYSYFGEGGGSKPDNILWTDIKQTPTSLSGYGITSSDPLLTTKWDKVDGQLYISNNFVSKTVNNEITAYHNFANGFKVENVPVFTVSSDTICIDGNLKLKKTGYNYNTKLLFGDGERAFIHEHADDALTVHADQYISLTTTSRKGINIEDINIKKKDNGVLLIDSDLVVTGGITAYGIGNRPISTIMDGVVTDEVTITKQSGKLVVIGGGGGGGVSEWNDIKNKPSWIGPTKPIYEWDEIRYRPTKLSLFTDDIVNGKYLSLPNGGAVAGSTIFNKDLLLNNGITIGDTTALNSKFKLFCKGDGFILGNLLVTGGITMYGTDGTVDLFLYTVKTYREIDSTSTTQAAAANVTTLIKDELEAFKAKEEVNLTLQLNIIDAIIAAFENINEYSYTEDIGAAISLLVQILNNIRNTN